jgi:hypothetical protein
MKPLADVTPEPRTRVSDILRGNLFQLAGNNRDVYIRCEDSEGAYAVCLQDGGTLDQFSADDPAIDLGHMLAYDATKQSGEFS